MSKRDYYETLNVSKSATEKELKSAFRKLAMEHHPDRNAGNAEAERIFKEVNEAYDVLKDPQKRAAYDQFGHAAFERAGAATPLAEAPTQPVLTASAIFSKRCSARPLAVGAAAAAASPAEARTCNIT